MSTRAFGEGLRRLLARSGLSQTDLAEALGVTRQTVNSWVTKDIARRKRPSEEMQERIAKVLGVKPAAIDKAGLGSGPDFKDYERTDSAAKTARQNATRAFSRRLREHDPRHLEHVQRTIDFPGLGSLRCDYASNELVMLLEYRTRHLERVYQALWRLFKARMMSERVGVERRCVLALVDTEGADEYTAEADLAGIELVSFETPERLADWIAKESPLS